MRKALMFSAMYLCAIMIGCSGKGNNVQVKGKVLLNGQPLSGATVLFHGEGGNSAITDEQGEFEIKGEGAHDIIKPGEYVVVISKFVDKKGKVADKEELEQLVAEGSAKEVVPARYSNLEFAELRATIKEGENQLPPFELKGKAR